MRGRKVMIMTASVGCGHDQAAQVIKERLEQEYSKIEVEIIDFMDIFPAPIGQFIKGTYLKMIDMLPSWYNLLYQFTMKLNQTSTVSDLFTYRYKKKVYDIITRFQPDLILFTNPFPATLVCHLKKKNKINTSLATVITDYTAHRVWIDPNIDNYFVGSNILKQEMVDQGIAPYKINVTGIPVNKKFNEAVNKKEVMKKLGLDSTCPTLLIMGGGLGLGSIEEILEAVDDIEKPLQILVVAGKNETLRKNIENRRFNDLHKVHSFGFCHNVHELMECSHLLISKAGGLTMTEAVNKKLPVLVFDPIPGQEVKNAEYFSGVGTAIYAKSLEQLKDMLEELLYTNREKRRKMVKCCHTVRKPNASEEITEKILKILYSHNLKENPMA